MSEPQSIEIAGFPTLYAGAEGKRRPVPLVFLHGLWSVPVFFAPYLRFFSSAGFQCYAPARRGRLGVPPEHGRGVRFADFVDDSLLVLDAIGEAAAVVGWSLGGLVAQKVAEAQCCRAAVFVAPVAPRDVRTLPRLASLPAYIRHMPAVLLGRPFLFTYGNAARTLLNRVGADDRQRLYDAMVPDSGIVAREFTFLGVPVDAARVECPVLCVVGTDDNITPARSVRQIARKHSAPLLEYPRHGHWLIEEPGWEAIAQDVLDWIEKIVLSTTEA